MTQLRWGYARASRLSPSLDEQIALLQTAGCTRIFSEARMMPRVDKPKQRGVLLRQLKPGTLVLATSIDRFGRTLDDLTAFLAKLLEAGGHLRCLTPELDSSREVTTMAATLQAIATAGHLYQSERVRDGLAASKAQGMRFGRESVVSPDRWPEMRAMIGDRPVKDILEHFGGISKQTFYNFRKRMEALDEPSRST